MQNYLLAQEKKNFNDFKGKIFPTKNPEQTGI